MRRLTTINLLDDTLLNHLPLPGLTPRCLTQSNLLLPQPLSLGNVVASYQPDKMLHGQISITDTLGTGLLAIGKNGNTNSFKRKTDESTGEIQNNQATYYL